jgi:hypothetical protein
MKNKEIEMNQPNRNRTPMNWERSHMGYWTNLIQSDKESPNDIRDKQDQQAADKQASKNSDATFLGWQQISSGDAIALYNVIAKNHPLYHSTVSARTLHEQNLKIPPTPLLRDSIENSFRK